MFFHPVIIRPSFQNFGNRKVGKIGCPSEQVQREMDRPSRPSLKSANSNGQKGHGLARTSEVDFSSLYQLPLSHDRQAIA